jgi:Holliday junction DNA helicase RuvA
VIASLRGTVTEIGPDSAVLEVGGLGLRVQCAPDTLAGLTVGRSATVPTALVVREDSLTLFGFADTDERVVFDLLQTATGVGPRLAQAVLAVLRPDDVRRAVLAEDLVTLTKVPGIGRKVGQRLVLELGDRLGPPVGGAVAGPLLAGPAWRGPVHAGLVNLGWSAREIDQVLDELTDSGTLAADAGVPDALRVALGRLDRG